MDVSYKLRVESSCPTDTSADVYDVEIIAGRTIFVEDILELVEELAADPIFQEDLTVSIAKNLRARVITTGNHYGVETRCEATG